MLTAYFDESYNHRTEKNPNEILTYTVGACLSTTEQWRKFKVRWISALKRAKIDRFHMTDFENRIGVYGNWSETLRIERLQRFHAIMNDHILFSCSATVNCADFDKLKIIRHRKFPKLDYYGFCIMSCMDAISSWCKRNNFNQPRHYVFSNLEKQGAFLDAWFGYCETQADLKEQYKLSGKWGKGLMAKIPQLQAPDIIAFELNKRAINAFGDSEKFIRQSLDNLNLTPDKFEPRYFETSGLENIFESGDIEPFGLEKI